MNSRNPEDSEHLKISPVLRLTEIQYIMAECYAREGNYGEAYRILNDVRGARNLSPLAVQGNWEEFQTDLIGVLAGSGSRKDNYSFCISVLMRHLT